jgi:hypothetical protein
VFFAVIASSLTEIAEDNVRFSCGRRLARRVPSNRRDNQDRQLQAVVKASRSNLY